MEIVIAIVATTIMVAAAWVALGYVGHWWSTKEARPSFVRYCVAFWPEWWATVRTWVGYPLGLTATPAFPTYAEAGGPPVALVHGYMMNRSSMAWLGRALRRRGFANIAAFDPRPLLAPLETQADALAADVKRLSLHAGGQRVVVVAHSQGGLLTRVALARHPDLPIAGVVTIGSPHAGTMTARLSRSPNGVQMRWGSPFLAALPAPAVPFVSIYSDLDNIVYPKETAKLGRSVELRGVGHHALCFSPVVVSLVVDAFADFRLS